MYYLYFMITTTNNRTMKKVTSYTGNERKGMVGVTLEGNDRECFVKKSQIKDGYFVEREKKVHAPKSEYVAIFAKVVESTERANMIQGSSEKTMWVPASQMKVVDGEWIEVKRWFAEKESINVIF